MAKETNKTPEELAAEARAKQAAEVKAKEEAEAKAEAKEKEAELKTVAIVKSFRDKNDHKTWYPVGSVQEFEASRAQDMITRGLAKFTEV